MTTVRGLVDEGTHLADTLTLLKSTCGAGGAVQEGVIEIQGEQRDRIAAKMTELGYRVKR